MWISLTYYTVPQFMHRFTAINTHVAVVNTQYYVDQINVNGPFDLFIQGSDQLRTDITYELSLLITFQSSWTTATTGMITLVTEFDNIPPTAVSILPYAHSLFTWIANHLFLLPVHSLGLIDDSFDTKVVVTTSFQLSNYISTPISAIYNTGVGYTACVHIMHTQDSHSPDVIKVIATYKPFTKYTLTTFITAMYCVGLYVCVTVFIWTLGVIHIVWYNVRDLWQTDISVLS
jgi:hypothetical protein